MAYRGNQCFSDRRFSSEKQGGSSKKELKGSFSKEEAPKQESPRKRKQREALERKRYQKQLEALEMQSNQKRRKMFKQITLLGRKNLPTKNTMVMTPLRYESWSGPLSCTGGRRPACAPGGHPWRFPHKSRPDGGMFFRNYVISWGSQYGIIWIRSFPELCPDYTWTTMKHRYKSIVSVGKR